MKWLASVVHSASTSSGHIQFLLMVTMVFGCALDANADMKVAQAGGPAGNWGPPGQVTIIPDHGLPCHIDQPPRGSYQRSCEQVTWDCKTLSAWCKPRQGLEHRTSLDDTSHCIGDIANMDGYLRCSKGGSPPAGSYMQSCQDIYVDNGVLHALCRNSNGDPLQTSLSFASCRNGIDNINGVLTCR